LVKQQSPLVPQRQQLEVESLVALNQLSKQLPVSDRLVQLLLLVVLLDKQPTLEAVCLARNLHLEQLPPLLHLVLVPDQLQFLEVNCCILCPSFLTLYELGGATSTSAFGSTMTPNSGTGNPSFSAYQEKEANSSTTSSFFSISALPAYRNYSFEVTAKRKHISFYTSSNIHWIGTARSGLCYEQKSLEEWRVWTRIWSS
jgi:hypothetical protein